MTLRLRIAISLLATLAGLMLLLAFVSSRAVLRGFERVEARDAEKNSERAEDALKEYLDRLTRTARDWSMWDDTVRYMADRNRAYLEANYPAETLKNSHVDLVAFLDPAGKLVWGRTLDHANLKHLPLPPDVLPYLRPGTRLSHGRDSVKPMRGVLAPGGEPLLVVSSPILDSHEHGPARGSLVLGRYLTAEAIRELQDVTHLTLTMRRADLELITPDLRGPLRLLLGGKAVVTETRHEDVVSGYTLLRDVFGDPAIILRVDAPREIYRQGEESVHTFLLYLLGAGLAVGVVTLLVVERAILGRVERLRLDVTEIRSGGDATGRVLAAGDDEIRVLADSINDMMGALQEAQETRAAEEERRRLVLRATNDAIWDWDVHSNGLWWSENLRDIFGYRSSQIQPTLQWWLERLHADDRSRVEASLERFIRSEASSWTAEYRLQRADGSYAHVLDRGHAVREADGRATRMIGAIMDLTTRKQTERELQKAKEAAETANRAKSEFLANMSHEIRTPMNGILGMTELVLDSDLTSDQRECLDMVRNSAESLLSIINDILDFSKIEAGRLELERVDFDLRECLDGALAPVRLRALAKGLSLDCAIAPDVPHHVQGDPGRLRQVLLNLAGNAIKFTHEGGIAVAVEPDTRVGGEVRLRFRVSDTGIGIPAEAQAGIFEAFRQADTSTTRNFGGTGLGLSIVERLVAMMGGRISLESEEGVGSTFAFTACFEQSYGVPSEPDPGPSDQEGAGAKATGRATRVLLAEDNAVNQQVAVRLLKRQGCVVTLVDNGRAAVDAVQRDEFDLVLMDVQMPLMDGLEASRQIRAWEARAGGRLRIVALTAHALKGDEERCLEAGMDGYLTKPLRREALFKVLDTVPLIEAASSPLPAGPIMEAPRYSEAHAPESPKDFEPPLDLVDLMREYEDDLDCLKEMAELFQRTAQEQIGVMREALARRDAEALARSAHQVKGMAGNFRGGPASAAALRLEKMGRGGDLSGAGEALEVLERELERLEAALMEVCREPAPQA